MTPLETRAKLDKESEEFLKNLERNSMKKLLKQIFIPGYSTYTAIKNKKESCAIPSFGEWTDVLIYGVAPDLIKTSAYFVGVSQLGKALNIF